MSSYERLIEAQVHTYESHLLRLEEAREEPIRFHDPGSPLHFGWQTEEIGRAGPMGVWDAVALSIEGMVERMEY